MIRGFIRPASRRWNSSTSSSPLFSGGSPSARAQASREANVFVSKGKGERPPSRVFRSLNRRTGARRCFSSCASRAQTSNLISCRSLISRKPSRPPPPFFFFFLFFFFFFYTVFFFL